MCRFLIEQRASIDYMRADGVGTQFPSEAHMERLDVLQALYEQKANRCGKDQFSSASAISP